MTTIRMLSIFVSSILAATQGYVVPSVKSRQLVANNDAVRIFTKRGLESSSLAASPASQFSPTYSIRPGTDEDAELFDSWMDKNREFHSAYNGETRTSQLKFKKGTGLQAIVPNLQKARVIFLLRDDLPDPVIGFCSFNIQYTDLGTPPFLYLQDIFIGEHGRGSGAGRLLMNEMAKIAKASYCSHMTWNADRRNLPAVKFYEHLGAQTTGTTDNWIHMQWSFLSGNQ